MINENVKKWLDEKGLSDGAMSARDGKKSDFMVAKFKAGEKIDV